MILGRCLARNARLYPHKPAIVSAEGRSISHSALNDHVKRLANAFTAHGIVKGDKLAILARNSPEYLEVYFAAGTIGTPLVPVNHQLKAADIHDRLAHSDARALVVDCEFLPLLDDLPASTGDALGGRVFAVDGNAGSLLSLADLISSAPATEPEVSVSPEDTLYIGYTSGTLPARRRVR